MDDYYVEYNEDFNKKILNLKLVIMLGFQNIKTLLLKDILQIGQKKILLLTLFRIGGAKKASYLGANCYVC